jgi:hypothetical protein
MIECIAYKKALSTAESYFLTGKMLSAFVLGLAILSTVQSKSA